MYYFTSKQFISLACTAVFDKSQDSKIFVTHTHMYKKYQNKGFTVCKVRCLPPTEPNTHSMQTSIVNLPLTEEAKQHIRDSSN